MRSLTVPFVLLALGCSSAGQPEDVGSLTPPPAESAQEVAPEQGGQAPVTNTAGAPDAPVAGSGGMLAMGGMGGEPVAGMGGIGGLDTVETLGGMGGQSVTAPCCSGVYNGFGQCLDDGSVCTGGMAGTTSTPAQTCDPNPTKVCYQPNNCHWVCTQGWCHLDDTGVTCVP